VRSEGNMSLKNTLFHVGPINSGGKKFPLLRITVLSFMSALKTGAVE